MRTLADAAAACGGRLADAEPSTPFRGGCIDSREVRPGSLFFALSGSRVDGHRFAAGAVSSGAAAAVVDPARLDGDGPPRIEAADPADALWRIGSARRAAWSGTMVGVTGSCGKTTCKEWIADLLFVRGPVLRSPRSFNNHLGVPLTLLDLADDVSTAVQEIGANAPGEIARLVGIVRPDVALVTNVGPVHLEGFGSVEGVERAKGEILEGLPSDGTLVACGDDPACLRIAGRWPGRTVTYGLREGNARRPERVERTAEGTRFTLRGTDCFLPVPGDPALYNALASLAVADACGIPPAEAARALAGLHPPPMRLATERIDGFVLLDDAYNANPVSVAAALDRLAAEPGRRIAVLGDMEELGESSDRLHDEAARRAASSGLDLLYGIGPRMRAALPAAVDAGLPAERAVGFPDAGDAIGPLLDHIRPGDVVLVKGSRKGRLERITNAMRARFGAEP